MQSLDPLLSPLEKLTGAPPRQHTAHLLGLLLRQVARSGEGLGVSGSLAQRALAGLRSSADGRVLRRLHWVLRSFGGVLDGSAEASAAAGLLLEWLPFHEGLVRQLSLLFDGWPTSAPTAPLDCIEARLAPEVAMRRLRDVAARLREAAVHSAAAHVRERCWQDLAELSMEAAGYDCATLGVLAAAALSLARDAPRQQMSGIEVSVPVVAGDGYTAALATLSVQAIRRPGGVPVTFEPAQAFDQAAQRAATEAVRAASTYLGLPAGSQSIVCRLHHPPGIIVEGTSLGPAVFAASVQAFSGAPGRVLTNSMAFLGTLDLVSGVPALGPVGSSGLLRAKYSAVPPDMLALYSNRERLSAPEVGTGAMAEAFGSVDDLWPRLGLTMTETLARQRRQRRQIGPVPISDRRLRLAGVCLLGLVLVWALLVRPGQAPSRQATPTRMVQPDAFIPMGPAREREPVAAEPPSSGGSDPERERSAPASGPMVPEEVAFRDSCRQQLTRLSRAMLMYCMDYEETLPLRNTWTPAIYPYLQRNYELLECPAAPRVYGYAMNAPLGGIPISRLSQPAQTFLLFDSSTTYVSASVDTNWIAYRHISGANVARADGSVRWYAH